MPRNAWMDLPEGPTRRFFADLNDLWWSQGAPSGRRIAAALKDSKEAVSQGTVQNLLNGPKLPKWETAAAVVRHLGGDHESFRSLWCVAAQSAALASRFTSASPRPSGARDSPARLAEPTRAPRSRLPFTPLDQTALRYDLQEVRRRGSHAVLGQMVLPLAVETVIPQHTLGHMTRAEALQDLLRRAVIRLPPLERKAAEALFGLDATNYGQPAATRRRNAALMYGVSTERFRKHQEHTITRNLAESISVLYSSSSTEPATGQEPSPSSVQTDQILPQRH